MKLTLLRCVQLILSAMDSDEVNSITDTTESSMVVDVLEQTYYDIASTIDFPDSWDFFELEASGDTDQPTLMTVPESVGKVEWIKYDFGDSGDTSRDHRDVTPLPRKQFYERMNNIDTADSNVYQFDLEVGTGTFDVRGRNDVGPMYYTTHDDRTLVFDSFDVSQGATLLGNRTWCYGNIIPTFTRSDSFIPDFEPRQFGLFFNEAKSQAFIDIKQTENKKAEQRARRGWNQAHRKAPTVPGGNIYDDYTYEFGRRQPRR
jgi:hypothetical protein